MFVVCGFCALSRSNVRKGRFTPLSLLAKCKPGSRPIPCKVSPKVVPAVSEWNNFERHRIVFRRNWRCIIRSLQDCRNNGRNSLLLVPRPELAVGTGYSIPRRSVGHIDLTAHRSAKADTPARTAPNNPEPLATSAGFAPGLSRGDTHGCGLSCRRLHKLRGGPPP